MGEMPCRWFEVDINLSVRRTIFGSVVFRYSNDHEISAVLSLDKYRFLLYALRRHDKI